MQSSALVSLLLKDETDGREGDEEEKKHQVGFLGRGASRGRRKGVREVQSPYLYNITQERNQHPMKATKQTHVTITLEMSETDAHWLQAVVQNPLVEDESIETSIKRERLFKALQEVLRKEQSNA